MINASELWIHHYSVRSWMSANDWDDYLRAVEQILDDHLVKLDQNDPIRRKADTKNGEGGFVVQFGEREDSRWLWGKFQKTNIEFQIQHYKAGKDSFGRLCDNRLDFFIPERMTFGPDLRKVIELFRLGNESLGAFYAYADFKNAICAKKPSTPSLDISRELLGVFWLTYFGPPYCAYFGRDRLLHLQQVTDGPADGITIQLAESPSQVPENSRGALEHEIAPESFAGNGGSKERGEHALTLAQLSTSTSQTLGAFSSLQ